MVWTGGGVARTRVGRSKESPRHSAGLIRPLVMMAFCRCFARRVKRNDLEQDTLKSAFTPGEASAVSNA